MLSAHLFPLIALQAFLQFLGIFAAFKWKSDAYSSQQDKLNLLHLGKHPPRSDIAVTLEPLWFLLSQCMEGKTGNIFKVQSAVQQK